MHRASVEAGTFQKASPASGDRGFEFRLPHRWPRRARAAIVHALSLARVALTAAGARTGDSTRLQREVALLRDELSIKDTRLERAPPHRRSHYPAVEHLAILELRAARGRSAAQSAEPLLGSEATVVSWMARLDEEGPPALASM